MNRGIVSSAFHGETNGLALTGGCNNIRNLLMTHLTATPVIHTPKTASGLFVSPEQSPQGIVPSVLDTIFRRFPIQTQCK